MTAHFLKLAIMLGATSELWLISLTVKDSSIVDIFWGAVIALVAWTTALAGPSMGPRAGLVLALVNAWSLRLSVQMSTMSGAPAPSCLGRLGGNSHSGVDRHGDQHCVEKERHDGMRQHGPSHLRGLNERIRHLRRHADD